MDLTSPDFANQGRIPARFTCEGDNVSPSFEWSGVPEGTSELAFTCEDPDAPGRTFVHWVLWGLDPATSGFRSQELPPGARHGRNDFGANAYGGPCPPPGHGTHHYHFTLYALGEPIEIDEGASIDELRKETAGRTLAEATLVGTYER